MQHTPNAHHTRSRLGAPVYAIEGNTITVTTPTATGLGKHVRWFDVNDTDALAQVAQPLIISPATPSSTPPRAPPPAPATPTPHRTARNRERAAVARTRTEREAHICAEQLERMCAAAGARRAQFEREADVLEGRVLAAAPTEIVAPEEHAQLAFATLQEEARVLAEQWREVFAAADAQLAAREREAYGTLAGGDAGRREVSPVPKEISNAADQHLAKLMENEMRIKVEQSEKLREMADRRRAVFYSEADGMEAEAEARRRALSTAPTEIDPDCQQGTSIRIENDARIREVQWGKICAAEVMRRVKLARKAADIRRREAERHALSAAPTGIIGTDEPGQYLMREMSFFSTATTEPATEDSFSLSDEPAELVVDDGMESEAGYSELSGAPTEIVEDQMLEDAHYWADGATRPLVIEPRVIQETEVQYVDRPDRRKALIDQYMEVARRGQVFAHAGAQSARGPSSGPVRTLRRTTSAAILAPGPFRSGSSKENWDSSARVRVVSPRIARKRPELAFW